METELKKRKSFLLLGFVYFIIVFFGIFFTFLNYESIHIGVAIPILQSITVFIILVTSQKNIRNILRIAPLLGLIFWLMYIFIFYEISGSLFEFRKSDSYLYFNDASKINNGLNLNQVMTASRYEIDDLGIIFLHYLVGLFFQHPVSLKFINFLLHMFTCLYLIRSFEGKYGSTFVKFVLIYMVSGVGIYHSASNLKESAMVFIITIIVINYKRLISYFSLIALALFRSILIPIYLLSSTFKNYRKTLILIFILSPLVLEIIALTLGIPTRLFNLEEFSVFSENLYLNYILFLYSGISFTPSDFCLSCMPNYYFYSFTILTNIMAPLLGMFCLTELARKSPKSSELIFFCSLIVILATLDRTLKIRYLMPLIPIYILLASSAIDRISLGKNAILKISLSCIVGIVYIFFWNTQYV